MHNEHNSLSECDYVKLKKDCVDLAPAHQKKQNKTEKQKRKDKTSRKQQKGTQTLGGRQVWSLRITPNPPSLHGFLFPPLIVA